MRDGQVENENSWVGLVVDLDESNPIENITDLSLPVSVRVAKTVDEAFLELDSGAVLVMAVAADKITSELDLLLKKFKDKVACIPEFQMVVCDAPGPRLLVSVFEYGIEKICGRPSFPVEFSQLAEEAFQLINDKESSESQSIRLSQAIKNADQQEIASLSEEIESNANVDFRAAFARGRAMEATGKYAKAAESYSHAQGMNKLFRPSSMGLGETLLITGKAQEALEIFNKLDRANPRDINRKINMIYSHTELGNTEEAAKLLEYAQEISPDHPRITEAKVHLLLTDGKIKEAFALLDDIQDAGPFLAAKLNDLGIKLSKNGKGKSALALYKKAHVIVRSELKYKISMNAALACRRLGSYDLALKYLNRCEVEFGSSFEKLDKIRAAVNSALGKQKKSA